MKVLHVISNLDPATGGPARALLGLARAQRVSGLEVEIFEAHRPGSDRSIAREIESARIPLHTLQAWSPRVPFFRGLRGTLEARIAHSDVVHLHGLWSQVIFHAARAARELRKPYVLRPCGTLDPWSMQQARAKKWVALHMGFRAVLDRAAALHFTTAMEREAAIALGLRASAIVEPNGIDLQEFEPLPKRGSFRDAVAGIGDRTLLLFLGRVHPKKGLELLIPALARTTGDVVLVIAGPVEVSYQQQLENLARRAGLGADRLRFVGMLHGEQRIAALADADLFVLTSHQENFGIAVVEALAAGTPVLISDQVAIHDEVTVAQVGAVVPLDEARIAAGLGPWLADRPRRVQAAGRARAFATSRFAWPSIAERWRMHYCELTARTTAEQR